MDLRYSELKYNGKIYTEQWKIDEILIKNKFNWLVNAEIKNARLEIFQDTIIWNAGIWYNGSWFFGVWRDGEWRYGTWQNGVWYNGVWKNGTFKLGIIYNGKFFKGKIEKGEIRGGQFIDVQIFPNVVEYTSDEYQAKKEEQEKISQNKTQIESQPQNIDKVKVTGSKPNTQIGIQQENKINNMKRIKTFESYNSINENIIDFIIWGTAIYSIWMLFWKYLRYYVNEYKDHPEEQPLIKLHDKIIHNLDKYSIWSLLKELKLSEKLIINENENLITIITDSKEEIKIDKEKKLLFISSNKIPIDQKFIDELKTILYLYKNKN